MTRKMRLVKNLEWLIRRSRIENRSNSDYAGRATATGASTSGSSGRAP